MELDHRFEVAAPVADTWPAFLDMPRLAPCMPGAEVTGVVDDRNVTGAAKVKVGPVNLRFAGRAEMVEIDDVARSAKMVAKGSDAKGRGNAEAVVRFSLDEAGPTNTTVEVHTTLNLTGSVAQYGRAAGLIDEIANQMIADFVDNLERELARDAQPLVVIGDESSGQQPDSSERPVSGLTLLFKALLSYFRKLFAR